jgi:hypothetical protein
MAVIPVGDFRLVIAGDKGDEPAVQGLFTLANCCDLMIPALLSLQHDCLPLINLPLSLALSHFHRAACIGRSACPIISCSRAFDATVPAW